MRLAERLRVERRLAAAETIVAERQLVRLIDLLADETNAAAPDVGNEIAGCLARAVGTAKSGAVETKAQFVRCLLGELAAAVPAISARLAAAIGVEVPSSRASAQGCAVDTITGDVEIMGGSLTVPNGDVTAACPSTRIRIPNGRVARPACQRHEACLDLRQM
jgi:hypothetical protein